MSVGMEMGLEIIQRLVVRFDLHDRVWARASLSGNYIVVEHLPIRWWQFYRAAKWAAFIGALDRNLPGGVAYVALENNRLRTP